MRFFNAGALVVLGLVACSGGDGDTSTETRGPTYDIPADLDAIADSESPSKRSEIRSAGHISTNSILIFGGNDGPIVNQIPSAAYRKDTWIFEPGLGWTKIEGDSPSKRARYAIASDEENNRALLFGGRFREDGGSGDYTLYNDLWAFDFLTREWTLLDDGSGDAPAPRYYSQGMWDSSTQTFYIWGGNLNTNALVFEVTDELWAWSDGTWTQLTPTGNAPSDRSFLGSLHDTARNELVIFGGQIGNLSDLAYNDTYALNIDSLEWRRLHNGKRSAAPTTRMHAQITYDPLEDRYLLFGGHTDFGDMNDLWAFDPEAGEWEEIYIADVLVGERFGCAGNPSEVPADYVEMDLSAPERRHNAMYTLMYNSLWVFGGMHAECSDHLDDTWRYDLTDNTWHELIEATSGESCLRADDACDCLCI